MERLELYVLRFVTEEVHHHFEICLVRNVARHNVEVRPVEEYLAEELERLPLRDIVLGPYEGRVSREELELRSRFGTGEKNEDLHDRSSCPGSRPPWPCDGLASPSGSRTHRMRRRTSSIRCTPGTDRTARSGAACVREARDGAFHGES